MPNTDKPQTTIQAALDGIKNAKEVGPRATPNATLRDKMYRDLIVPMFGEKWQAEHNEKVLDLLVRFREEIEHECKHPL